MNDETNYRLFKILETKPLTGQRELAETLGVSLGKANYCLKALLNKGLVKIENFRRSSNKKGYLYKLTPEGMREKAAVTLRFLKHKMAEYENLRHEIQTLKSEVSTLDAIEEVRE